MEPITHEQLDLFSEQTRRAVHKAVRKYARAALLGFVVLLIGIGYALHVQSQDSHSSRHAIVQSGRAVAVDSCNGRYQDRQGLRNLLISAEQQIHGAVKRGEITPEQANRAQNFYSSQLVHLKLPDCRKAAKIITANPAQTVRIPKPLFPPAASLPSPDLHDSGPNG